MFLQVFGYDNFSDFAINQVSGSTYTLQPIEGLEASAILFNFVEQIKYEKGGQGSVPVRIFIDGDKEGIQNTLYDECMVEDSYTEHQQPFSY